MTQNPSAYPPGVAWRFAFAYAAIFVPFGIFTPYLQVLLSARGFGRQAVGTLQGCLELMAVLAPPLWGFLSDATQRPRAVLGGVLLASVPAFLLLGQADTVPLGVACAALFGLLYRPAIPLATGLTFRFIRARGGDYGRVRVAGSIAFVLPIAVLELLGVGEAGGERLVLWGFALTGLVSAASMLLLPRDEQTRDLGGDARLPWRQILTKAFLAFALAAFLGRLAMMSYYHFFTLYLKEHLGFVSAGWLWILGPVSEVPIIFFSDRLVRRFGVRGLFALGCVGIVVRLAALSLVSAVWQIIPLQLLHALTFGAYHVASVTYVSRAVPERLQATAQTVFSAFSMGLAGLCGGALGGWVAAGWGYPVLYAVFAGIAFLGLVVFWVAVPAGGGDAVK